MTKNVTWAKSISARLRGAGVRGDLMRMATELTSDSDALSLDDPAATAAATAPETTAAPAAAPAAIDRELEAAMTAVDFGQMSDEQLEALGSGDHDRIAQALNLETAPTRISLRAVTDPEERRAVADATRLLRSGKHSTLRGALIEVMGLAADAAPEAAAEQEAHQEAATEVSGEIAPGGDAAAPGAAALEAEITSLRADLKQARDYFDYEGAMELQDRLAGLQGRLSETLHTEARHQAERREWAEAESFSRAAIMAAYPALNDPESEFSQLVEDEIILAEARGDELLFAPDWPEKIAARADGKHGGRFGGGIAEPGAAMGSRPIPQPPPRPGVRLPGSPVGPGAATTSVTAQTALAEFDRLTLEEQDAVLTRLDIAQQRRGSR